MGCALTLERYVIGDNGGLYDLWNMQWHSVIRTQKREGGPFFDKQWVELKEVRREWIFLF